MLNAFPPPVRRVILVVLDGLRPDAMEVFDLQHLRRLSERGAYTGRATTVSPSVTAAAMASLLTGVPPLHHGLTSDRFHVPRPRVPLSPLPATLAREGIRVSSFMREVPLLFRPFARTSATKLGIRSPEFAGNTAHEILDVAARALCDQRDGLIVMHWPDADAAGHAFGWMSPEYGRACRDLDDALGILVGNERVLADPDTMLIALADHGGGGIVPDDHDGDHPLNLTIPLLIVGGRVPWCTLYGDVSILDVPPTIAWALGVDAPYGWPGRALCVVPEHESVLAEPGSIEADRRVRQA